MNIYSKVARVPPSRIPVIPRLPNVRPSSNTTVSNVLDIREALRDGMGNTPPISVVVNLAQGNEASLVCSPPPSPRIFPLDDDDSEEEEEEEEEVQSDGYSSSSSSSSGSIVKPNRFRRSDSISFGVCDDFVLEPTYLENPNKTSTISSAAAAHEPDGSIHGVETIDDDENGDIESENISEETSLINRLLLSQPEISNQDPETNGTPIIRSPYFTNENIAKKRKRSTPSSSKIEDIMFDDSETERESDSDRGQGKRKKQRGSSVPNLGVIGKENESWFDYDYRDDVDDDDENIHDFAGLDEVSQDCCAGIPDAYHAKIFQRQRKRFNQSRHRHRNSRFLLGNGDYDDDDDGDDVWIERPEDAKVWCFGCQWGARGHRPVDNEKIKNLVSTMMTLILNGNTSIHNIARHTTYMYRVTIQQPALKMGQWLPDWSPLIVKRHIENMTEPRIVQVLTLRQNLTIYRRLCKYAFLTNPETGQEVPAISIIREIRQLSKHIRDSYHPLSKESFLYNEDMAAESWAGGALIHPARIAPLSRNIRFPGAPVAAEMNQAGVRKPPVSETGEDTGTLRGPANDEQLIRGV